MTENWKADECRVFMGDGGISLHNVPNGAERARLIASAPDLLEASRLALNALVIASRQLTEDHKMVLEGKGWAAQDIASLRAAIARATGEAA